jgi:type III secretion system (T3SS) SseB-like protein
MQTQMPDFQPANDLEIALVQAHAGKFNMDNFMAHLLKSQATILLDRPVPDSGLWDNNIKVLILTNPSGLRVVAIFTSPERATPMALQSSYRYSLVTDVKWIIKQMGEGIGVVINPGSPLGLDIAAVGVTRLKAMASTI